jgi:hypothetical protein
VIRLGKWLAVAVCLLQMKKLILLSLSVALLSGCISTVHLYPVQGPLSMEAPVSVLPLRLAGPTISVVLADGELCSGPWSAVTADNAAANEMSAAWDAVYGSGFYVARVVGTRVNRAILVGNKGTRLQVESADLARSNAGEPANIFGVARDSGGNVYKVNF